MTNDARYPEPDSGPNPMALPTPIKPKPSSPDDMLRRASARRLARYLDRSDRLLARCEDMANDQTDDKLGPLGAAARLLNANARVAQVLAQMALVERRHRTISERIQPPKEPTQAELNSKKRTPEQTRQDIGEKFARIEAQQRLEKLKHPIDPQQEANLRLQEEDWQERLRDGRGFRDYYF